MNGFSLICFLRISDSFDHPTVEQDIRHFRDWYWTLCQYLSAIDEGYQNEIQQLNSDPTKLLDMQSASMDVRQRSTKLYALLASSMKNRSLSIVRGTSDNNGFEALRQLVLAFRPNTQSRGLALLTAVTSWPSFAMNQPLQGQLLKLEDGFEEVRKTGTNLEDSLKMAILLKCLGGALKTQLNLTLKDDSTYTELREAVLKWDRAQQRWQSLVVIDDADPNNGQYGMPMDINAMQQKGKNKGKHKGKGQKGKGKYKGKQQQKGKGDGKSKSSEKVEKERAKVALRAKAKVMAIPTGPTSTAIRVVLWAILQEIAGKVFELRKFRREETLQLPMHGIMFRMLVDNKLNSKLLDSMCHNLHSSQILSQQLSIEFHELQEMQVSQIVSNLFSICVTAPKVQPVVL